MEHNNSQLLGFRASLSGTAKNTTFWRVDLFLSSAEKAGRRQQTTSVTALRCIRKSHSLLDWSPNIIDITQCSAYGQKQIQFLTLCVLSHTRRWTKSKKKNPTDPTWQRFRLYLGGASFKSRPEHRLLRLRFVYISSGPWRGCNNGSSEETIATSVRIPSS
jgi:hypothetical protein